MTAHVPWREPAGVIEPKRPDHATHPVAVHPLAELDALRRQLDQAYERWFDGESRTWAPAIDVERGDKALTMRADAPGVDPENIKIEVEDGVLTISGEHEERKEQSGKNYLRRERRHGSFSRSMAIPAGVDASKIKAKTKDGVVEVRNPASG